MRDPLDSPVLKIAGKELEVVTDTKLLGLTVQSKLSRDMQADSMVGTKCKCSRRLYVLNRSKRFGLPEEDLVSVFVSLYVRPVFEYATPVWQVCLTEEQSKITGEYPETCVSCHLGRQVQLLHRGS